MGINIVDFFRFYLGFPQGDLHGFSPAFPHLRRLGNMIGIGGSPITNNFSQYVSPAL